MKVLFDNQIFILQKYGGISRYFFELMSYLNNNNFNFELPLAYSDNDYLKEKNFYSNSPLLSCEYLPFKKKIRRKVNDLKIKNVLRKQNFDLFHPTFYNPDFLKDLGNKPFIITVYDMINELFAYQFADDKIPEYKKLLVEKASKIIAISKSTKKDLIKLYGINEDKIEIIYLASSFKDRDFKIGNDIHLPEKYILFVGNRGYYKNFEFFIKSISQLLVLDNKLKVICAGGPGFSEYEQALLSSLNIKENIIHYSINNDMTLIQLYKNALAFVFPSLYEGFGIPVLEAFSCGCPVILSNTSSLPEIANDAAIYFDPKDEISIKDNIEKVIYNEELRKNLIKEGFIQLSKFSWDKTAEQTKKLYESVI